MDFPVIFRLGPAAISAHLLFEVLAFTLGFRYFLWLRKRRGDQLEQGSRVVPLAGATLGALFGSRLLGILETPELLFNGQGNWMYFTQSKTIVGGLLGGLIGVELAKKMVGETRSSGDLFTFPIMLGMIIGRIGCFLSGVGEPTYGLPSGLPWAMDLGDGIRRHPTALYEILFLAGWWMVLRYLKSHYPLKEGALFKLFMTGYLLYRFLVEFIRPGEPIIAGINPIQIACLLGLAYYWRVFLQPVRHLGVA